MPPAPSNNLPLWTRVTLLALGAIGFADATFLTIKRYTGGSLPCSLLKGCDVVTTSAYSAFAGIPVSLLGALFYLSVIMLTVLYWQTGKRWVLIKLWVLSILAFLASLGFVYVQGWILHAWCLYCLVSAAISTLVCALATVSVCRASTTSAAV